MHRRTFTIGLLAASLLGSLWALPAKAERLASIKQAGIIKIAIPADFPPFGSTGPDMKPQGYDIDTAELIGRELKVKVELVPVSSANRIAYLTTGKADLLISSLGKNPEREKVINFSVAYAPFFNGVFGTKDLTLDKPEGLAGKTVGVTRGSIEDLELSKVIPASANLKRFEDNNATIAAYLAGQVQVVATGNVVAATINAQSKRPRRLEQKFLIKNSPCFVGVNKDDPQPGRMVMSYQFDFLAVAREAPELAAGLARTVELTAVACIAGLLIGIVGAVCRAWQLRPFNTLFAVYVEMFRNTPFLVQLFFLFFGLPTLGIEIAPDSAAMLAMVINLGAYAVEIIRSGIEATPKGQIEAAQALALKRWQIFLHVVLRPALLRVWPAMTSQVVIVMLGSAVCAQISTEELSYAASLIQSRNFRAFETYFVTAGLYLALALLLRQTLLRGGGRLLKRGRP